MKKKTAAQNCFIQENHSSIIPQRKYLPKLSNNYIREENSCSFISDETFIRTEENSSLLFGMVLFMQSFLSENLCTLSR